MIKILLILIILIMLNSPAFSQDQLGWKVSELARAPGDQVQLRDSNNRAVKTLNTRQMVYLHSIMSAISETSETFADFVIVPGKFPNAFASSNGQGQDFIAINFAMLELLGSNVDMSAALIGHELAHLKLNHGAETREARQRNGDPVISASKTRYSRDNEREADYLGTIWAVEAGYDPKGAVALQEGIYRSSRIGGANTTHPSSIERITVLKSLVRRLSK